MTGANLRNRIGNGLASFSVDPFVPDQFYEVKASTVPKASRGVVLGLVFVIFSFCITAFTWLLVTDRNNVIYSTTTSIQTTPIVANLANEDPPIYVDSCSALIAVTSETEHPFTDSMGAIIASVENIIGTTLSYDTTSTSNFATKLGRVLGTTDVIDKHLAPLDPCMGLQNASLVLDNNGFYYRAWMACGGWDLHNISTSDSMVTWDTDSTVDDLCISPNSMLGLRMPYFEGSVANTGTGAKYVTVGDATSARETYQAYTLFDMNGDGYKDIVAGLHTARTSTKLVWYETIPGTTPTFVQHDIAVLPVYVSKVIIADMNNDGYPDVVFVDDFVGGTCTVNCIFEAGIGTGSIRYISNSGGGTFDGIPLLAVQTVGTPLYTTSFINGLVADDINQDGYIDIVATLCSALSDRETWKCGQITTYIYINNKGGVYPMFDEYYVSGLQYAWLYPTSNYISVTQGYALMRDLINIADIDGDGYKDIVVRATWAKNTPGSLPSAWPVHSLNIYLDTALLNCEVSHVSIHDINNDNMFDIVLSTFTRGAMSIYSGASYTYVTEVIQGVGGGVFGNTYTYSMSGGGVLSVSDVNHDGQLDFLLAAPSGSAGSLYWGSITTYINTGNFTFSQDSLSHEISKSICGDGAQIPSGFYTLLSGVINDVYSVNPSMVFVCVNPTSGMQMGYVELLSLSAFIPADFVYTTCVGALNEAIRILDYSPPYICSKMNSQRNTVQTSLSIAFANTQTLFAILVVLAVLVLDCFKRHTNKRNSIRTENIHNTNTNTPMYTRTLNPSYVVSSPSNMHAGRNMNDMNEDPEGGNLTPQSPLSPECGSPTRLLPRQTSTNV